MKEREGGFRPRQEAPNFAKLGATDLLNGIEDGKITQTAAVRVLVRKQLDLERQISCGAYLKEMEDRYARIINARPQQMAVHCQELADEYMTFSYPVPSDRTNYIAAEHWYEMAGRFAQEAAGSKRQRQDRITQPGQPPDTQPYHPYQVAGMIMDRVEDGSVTNPEAVQATARLLAAGDKKIFLDDVRKQKEAESASWISAVPKDMVRFCLDEASARMSRDVPESVHIDYEAAARWYAMAARFARKAQEDKDDQNDSTAS